MAKEFDYFSPPRLSFDRLTLLTSLDELEEMLETIADVVYDAIDRLSEIHQGVRKLA